MKKIIIASIGIIAGFVMSASFAQNQNMVKSRSGFAPTGWSSSGINDVITIQDSANSAMLVEIYVSNATLNPNQAPAGINVKNCANGIIHVNAGSSIICKLGGVDGPSEISFSADKNDATATGAYQVE